MSDSVRDFSWGEKARRLASEFDQGLGSPAAEIVTFEASERAIAVGIALAGSCTQLPIGKLIENNARPPARARIRLNQPSIAAAPQATADPLRELARIRRVIVLGLTRCVNRVYVLHGPGNKMYAVHGLGAEQVETALRADMDAIAAWLAEAG